LARLYIEEHVLALSCSPILDKYTVTNHVIDILHNLTNWYCSLTI